jgi:thiol-disulfide isomerase/thioredoxin
MKATKVVYPLLLLIFLSFQGFAQTRMRDLKVGETLPDFEIKNIINSKVSSAKVSNFKGKLLIIDFWATWCSPCIASFPKLDSLQNKFRDKMQILLVTEEDSVKAGGFIKKLATVRKTSLASATDDKIFRRLFIHKTIPHYVWLDQNATIIAITGSEALTEANVSAAVNGEKFEFKLKDEGQQRVVGYPDISVLPIVNVRNAEGIKSKKLPDSTLLFHSVLTKYIEGMGESSTLQAPLHFGNASIAWLYRFALSGSSSKSINSKHLKIEIPDSILYKKVSSHGLKGSEATDWLRTNGYCYELTIPAEFHSRRFEIMLADLNRYFGVAYNIEGVREMRLEKCLALIRINKDYDLASKGGEPISDIDALSLKFKNGIIQSFLLLMSKPLQLHPVLVDETNYSGKVDIELNCPLSNLGAVNKELDKYGLKLIEKEIMMSVPVIRMKKG